MKKLTDKQKNILDFIEDFLDQENMAPTVYEIAEHFKLKTSTVFAHLRALQRKNELTRSSKARSIALTRRPRARHFSAVLSIPLLGRINAGLPADSPELREGTVQVCGRWLSGADSAHAFALKVVGESMRDLGILEGDIVIVDGSADLYSPGDVVVALVNNENTVKSFYRADDGRVELRPANAEFQPMFFNPDEVKLQGRVVGLQRKY